MYINVCYFCIIFTILFFTRREKRCIPRKIIKAEDDWINWESSSSSPSHLKELEIVGFDFGEEDGFDIHATYID